MTLLQETRDPARPATHPLHAEFSRGSAPWAGVAVLLTLGVGLALTADTWQGGWAETRGSLHSASVMLGGPLALAAGCWQGGRERRRRTEDLGATASRGPLARFLAAALPTAAWVVAGYAATAGLALLATWPYATGDRPRLFSLPADAVFLAACTVAGHVVGRLVAWRLAAPLLGVCGYIGLGAPQYGDPGAVRHLVPSVSVLGDVPVWWQPLATMVWVGGLGVTAVLAYAARRRYTALLPLAASATAAALLVHTGSGLWHDNPLDDRQVCDTSTTPDICVSARYEGLLPQVRNALSGLTDRLEGVENLPVRFEDGPGEPRPDEAQLPMLVPLGPRNYVVRGRLTDPDRYAWEALMLMVHRECDRTDARLARTDDAVTHWLAPSPAEQHFDELMAKGSRADRAELEALRKARARLASMGDEERRAWLSAYFAAAGDCDQEAVPTL
ncbi:hypothetical protein [Streptomyces cavernae]|uniref:hypothetical protein n=1 Tax=Streptomyces cavernae TaxID=2259034 RepID=UPI000FEB63E9|nr:hypothetical protein [Streptomyces cavernae]